LPDRYVEGTCPNCGFARARGDQCDNCGRSLDPVELIDPRCRFDGSTPERRPTEHFFLKLSAYNDRVVVHEGGNVHVTPVGIGGSPGTPGPGCSQIGEQQGIIGNVPPGELPSWLEDDPVQLTLSRVRREGEDATVQLSNTFGDEVVLLVGFQPQFTYLPNFHGVQLVTASDVIVLGSVPIDFSFDVRIPDLGPGVESLFAYVQPFSRNSQGTKTLGSPSVILMLDEQF
jgi:hypothetical protein